MCLHIHMLVTSHNGNEQPLTRDEKIITSSLGMSKNQSFGLGGSTFVFLSIYF